MKNEILSDLNRREFLRGGSMASLMVMMGGVAIGAEETKSDKINADGSTNYKGEAAPVNVGVIGCGIWAREILKTLAIMPNGPVVAICDTYPAYLKRAGDLAPKAEKYSDYTKLLENKSVQAVIVGTPTHQHKDIVLAALAAGKHVYCEAPMAATLEDARTIAQAAKKAIKVNFQVGLQSRSDKQIANLATFVRTGVMGQTVKGRSQFHKKMSWRQASPNPDREKEINWRLDKQVSLGMVGEIGVHHIDVANWFFQSLPVSVAGFGSLIKWKDGRDVPDSAQVVFEYPGGLLYSHECTINNSFDAEMEMFFGTDCAIMMRERRAWMFKEADAPLLGWEVYANKQAFFKESGIVLGAGSTSQKNQNKNATEGVADEKSALQYSLESFLINSNTVGTGVEDFAASFDVNDSAALKEYLAGLEKSRLAGAGWKDGYEAAVTVIKANESVLKGEKIRFSKEWFDAG
jgi:predicted dehydrogenase